MTSLTVRFLVIAFTIIVNIFLSVLVLKSNRRSATNIIFALLSIVTTLWLTVMFVSINPHFVAHELLWVRLSLFLASPQILLFYLLAITIPNDKLTISKMKKLLLALLSAIVMLVSVSPLSFSRVKIVNHNIKAIPIPQAGMVLFVIYAICFIIAALYSLYKKLHMSSGYRKEQYRYVLAGLFVMLTLLFFTVLVPVVVFKSSFFIPLAPFYTIVFLGATTYAIIRNRLFDIKSAVARSVAYLLVIITMTVGYGILIFGLIDFVFSGSNQSNVRQIYTVLMIAPLALSFQYIKQFFDYITNKLFFKNAYDIQNVLDVIGGIVVSEINLKELLSRISTVLTAELKSNFVQFVLINDKGVLFYGEENDISGKLLTANILKQKVNLIYIEELRANSMLYKVFHDNNIALSLRLESHEQKVGYILLGEKKSGDIYTVQDRRLLTIAANELAVAIQNSLRFEEIQQFNVTLQKKIDNAVLRLRESNQKLKILDEAKDDFVSMASHQLRTPLTSVKGNISLVLDGDAGEITPLQRQLLEQAFISSQRMVFLIADLLNVSRLKTGKFVIEPSEINLSHIIEDEVSQLVGTAKSRHLSLIYNKPDHITPLMLDETKTRQVIMNFVDNAIYYTPAGGKIEVVLSETPSSVECRVIDNGIGVPKNEQHHLFTKFYRANNARKARPDGTGLGLFMAKKVIIAEGGSIIFQTKEGEGSTFGFSFPKSRLAVSANIVGPNSAKKTEPALK